MLVTTAGRGRFRPRVFAVVRVAIGMIALLGGLSFVRPAFAAIAVDNTSSAHGDVSSLTWAHTVGSGADRILIVGVSIDDSGTTISSVTYGGTTLLLVGQRAGTQTRAAIYRLIAPSVGTSNVVVTLSSTDGVVGGAVSFTGVDQTTPSGALRAGLHRDAP